jgi:hypothetical protein
MKPYLSFVKSLTFFFVWIPLSWCQASPGALSAATPIVLSSSIKQIATLTSSDEGLGDGFGSQVLADPSTAVVGAPSAGYSACGWAGFIFVFVKPEGGWQNMTQTAELAANSSCLMSLMAFKGDTIVGGQESCTGNGNFGPGALYVWVKPSSGWTNRQPDATLSDGMPGCVDSFAAGAVMNDTRDVILASGGANQQVFVFARPPGGWTNMSKPTAVIKAPQGSSLFGASLAISGNILAVSAPNTTPSGAIYVFQIGSGGKLTQLAVLSTTDGQVTGVGDSLVMTDDTIVAGAPIYNNDQGAVYVFSKPSGGWTNMTETARLTVSTPPSDYPVFGSSVAFDPTRQFIIVGFDSVGSPAPIAYLYRRPASGWQTTDTPTARIFANGKGASEIAATSGYFVVTDLAASEYLGEAFVFAP